jgi:acyl-CoA thioesterase-1
MTIRLLLFSAVSLMLTSCGQSQEKTLNYLALGDSYTIGEAVIDEERYPLQLVAKLADKDLTLETKIVATSGWRTDDLMNGIEKEKLGNDYDLVSLLIGANNQFQNKPFSQYEKEFTVLLAAAIEHAGGDTNRVFVVGIPDYYYTPYGQVKGSFRITDELNAYNTFAEATCIQWGVPFVDITAISQKGIEYTELVAMDGLHPSGKQYGLWVEEFLNTAKSTFDYAVEHVR